MAGGKIMAKMTIQKNYRMHVLDIKDIVCYFEGRVEHMLDTYIISHNAVDLLFDYCIHRAISFIFNIKLNLNGNQVSSSYYDNDIFKYTFEDEVGEFFINQLYYKLIDFGLIVDNRFMMNQHLHTNIQPMTKSMTGIVKLTVVGNALWIFEGINNHA